MPLTAFFWPIRVWAYSGGMLEPEGPAAERLSSPQVTSGRKYDLHPPRAAGTSYAHRALGVSLFVCFPESTASCQMGETSGGWSSGEAAKGVSPDASGGSS